VLASKRVTEAGGSSGEIAAADSHQGNYRT
jgi:hypothetical protein